MLIKTPVGTSLEEVREFLKEMDWVDDIRERPVGEDRERGRYMIKVLRGDYLLDVFIGKYQGFPWEVWVSVVWVFENGFLTEIVDEKAYDAL